VFIFSSQLVRLSAWTVAIRIFCDVGQDRGREIGTVGRDIDRCCQSEGIAEKVDSQQQGADSHTIQWVVSGSHTCDSSLCMAIVSDKHELYSATVG
jgi:hypothetical protein